MPEYFTLGQRVEIFCIALGAAACLQALTRLSAGVADWWLERRQR